MGREKRRWPVIKLKYTFPGWYFALYSSQTSKLYIYLKKKNTTQIPRSFIIQIIETASDSVEKVNECMLSGNEMIQHNETIKVKGTNEKNGKKKKNKWPLNGDDGDAFIFECGHRIAYVSAF